LGKKRGEEPGPKSDHSLAAKWQRKKKHHDKKDQFEPGETCRKKKGEKEVDGA